VALPADKWDAYLTWNNSIADVIYPFGNEAPVACSPWMRPAGF